MIRTLVNGIGIAVSGGSNYSTPYIDTTRPSAGLVRYNSNNFEVYDGSSWIIMSGGSAQVSLDGVTLEAVNWVRAKMEQEKRMSALAKQHPAVADAQAAVEHAQQQLDIVAALVQK